MEERFMACVKRMKDAYNLCSDGDELADKERDKIHFYLAVRSVLRKLTKGDAPDTAQMNARVAKMVEEAIQADGVTEIFTLEKETERLEQDIFSDEYLERINRIPMVNTKIKILQRLLKNAISNEELRLRELDNIQELRKDCQTLLNQAEAEIEKYEYPLPRGAIAHLSGSIFIPSA